MILSMTGYGKASETINEKKLTVEIRSVNNKYLDVNLRLPGIYKEKELELRNYLNKSINRGKVDFSIFIEGNTSDKIHQINQELVESYYNSLVKIANKVNVDSKENLFAIAMKMPDVLKTEYANLDEEEWEKVIKLIEKAIENFTVFRQSEGEALEQDILERINKIKNLTTETEQFESERIENIKDKIYKNLKEQVKDKVDENRFEQELIYYLEKFDTTEEKVRLKKHCEYFTETAQAEINQGKKLNFISQEIGREVNTLGSKANHHQIQKIVINMKDELEKIKEQILNVL